MERLVRQSIEPPNHPSTWLLNPAVRTQPPGEDYQFINLPLHMNDHTLPTPNDDSAAQPVLASDTTRNVWNRKELDDFVKSLAEDVTPEPALRNWIAKALPLHMLRDDENECLRQITGTEFTRLFRENPWITKTFSRNEDLWEFEITAADKGRIKQQVEEALAHVSALLAAGTSVKAVGFWTAVVEGRKVQLKHRSDAGAKEKKTKVFKCKSDAQMTWFALQDQYALKHESTHMGHCVGRDDLSYGQRLMSGGGEIWSLRDDKNIPHVTASLDEVRLPGVPLATKVYEITQIKGKANQAPVKYKKQVVELLNFVNRKFRITRIYITDFKALGIDPKDLEFVVDPDDGRIPPRPNDGNRNNGDEFPFV